MGSRGVDLILLMAAAYADGVKSPAPAERSRMPATISNILNKRSADPSESSPPTYGIHRSEQPVGFRLGMFA